MKKKKIVTGILSMLLAGMFTIAHAQTAIGIRTGAFIGTTSSDMVGNIVPLEWERGPEFGLYAEQGIRNNLSVVSGIEYSKKGFSIDQGMDFNIMGIDLPIGARADFNLHYMELPLALKYTFGNSNTKAYGIAGISTGYATSGSIKTTANLIVNINISEVDIPFGDNNISRWNNSALVGIGAEHQVNNKGKIFVDLRYKHGLGSIISDTFINVDLANRGFSIGIGYAMKL